MSSYSEIIRQAQSSRIKYVYTALLEIRKTHIRTPAGVGKLVSGGLVHRLIDLVWQRDSLEEEYKSKVVDMAISVLSNMCMEECTRNQVLKEKGLAVIVELFLSAKSDVLQNRTCRCVANMMLSPRSWELAESSALIEKLVKLLNNTENIEFKQTYIRAIRLLGKTGTHVQRLLDNNAICCVAKHLCSEDTLIVKSALKCLHSLSIHCCTPRFASQVISGGNLSVLLELVENFNEEAFRLVVKLCDHPNFRPGFGNAGGIKLFNDMVCEWKKSSKEVDPKIHKGVKTESQTSSIEQDQKTKNDAQTSGHVELEKRNENADHQGNDTVMCKSENKWKLDAWALDLLSVLSLCCKEAVNRVKLREEKVLGTLLEALKMSAAQNVHGRIVSALVCFLYDEAGFQILLDNDLVPILIVLLKQNIKNFPVYSDKNEANHQDINVIEKEKQTYSETKDGINKTAIVNKVSVDELLKYGREQHYVKESVADQELFDVMKSASDDEEKINSELFEKSRPVYSIDSPTYMPQTNWNQLNSGNVKCIEKFSSPETMNPKSTVAYSPISNISYYSAGESSPEYSPNVSSSTEYTNTQKSMKSEKYGACSYGNSLATGCQSPENYHPKYPKYTAISPQMYRVDTSPYSSPEKTGPIPRNRWSFSSSGSDLSEPESPLVTASNIDSEEELLDQPNALEYSPVVSPSGTISDDDDPELEVNVIKKSVVNKEIKAGAKDDGKSDKEMIKSLQKDGDELQVKNNKADTEFLKIVKQNTRTEEIRANDILENDNDQSKQNVFTDTALTHEIVLDEAVELDTEDEELLVEISKEVVKPVKLISQCQTMENNIMILLSRVSQMNDPTIHLVTKDTVNCLLDYISNVDQPLARCPRLLSRVFRNPHCFQRLLSLNVPLLVYMKLLQDKDIENLAKALRGNTRKRRRLSSGSPSYVEDTDTDSDRFSLSEDSNQSMEMPNKKLKGTKGPEVKGKTLRGVYHQQTVDVCEPGRSGLALLEDLCGVTDTIFGRGCVSRLLCTISDQHALALCVNMLFITWSLGSRQFYFSQIDMLTKILASLRGWKNLSADNLKQIICGLRFLASIIKNKISKNVSGPASFDAGIPSFMEKCERLKYDETSCETVKFVVDGQEVVAKRSVLVTNSDIFAAMLDGQFSETSLKEIPIPGSSAFAFKSILHYLHGCQVDRCDHLQKPYSMPISAESADLIMSLANEADKYMIPSLKDIALECLHKRYIISESSIAVFKFGVIHQLYDLLKAAVICMLIESKETCETARYFLKLMKSKYSDIFLHVLSDIFIE